MHAVFSFSSQGQSLTGALACLGTIIAPPRRRQDIRHDPWLKLSQKCCCGVALVCSSLGSLQRSPDIGGFGGRSALETGGEEEEKDRGKADGWGILRRDKEYG